MTFDQLQMKYNISEKTRYQYIQLKEAIKSTLNINTFVNRNHELFEKLRSLPFKKITITNI